MDTLATKLCLLLSLAAWAAANSSDMAAFASFQTQYNKVYSSPQERQERFAVFARNMAKIRSHNSKPNVSWTMGVNQFADMTGKNQSKNVVLRYNDKRCLKCEYIFRGGIQSEDFERG